MAWYRASGSPGEFQVFVKAKPRASRSRVVGVAADGNALEVALAAPPVDGEANDALRQLFAKSLGIRQSDVVIARGGQSRYKQITIIGIDEETLKRLELP